jgi:hypothetical protein
MEGVCLDMSDKKVKCFIDLSSSFIDSEKLISIYKKINLVSFEKNITELRTGNISFDFISQLPNGYVELKCPINNSISKCQHSVPLIEANALYFKGKEPFYVIQGNFCVEAFYYPETSVFILLRGCLDHQRKLKRLLSLLNNESLNLYAYYEKATRFDGFYCFHQSPFHYYYFKVSQLLPALNKVKDLTSVKVLSILGKSYLNLAEVSDRVEKDIILKAMYTVKQQLTEGTFYVCIGEHRKKLSAKAITECDTYVKDYILRKEVLSEQVNELKKLKHSSFVLWLGITSGKRTWVEQVAAYKELIQKLLSEVGNIVVITDGWTKGRGGCVDEPVGDARLDNELSSYFKNNGNVIFISIVGAEAETKLKVALDVDFFIANHSTGSIWVSRIVAAKGITHISNAARNSTIVQHVHPNAQLIPSEFIKDLDTESGAQTPFHVSYSITPENFVKNTFSLAIEQYKNKKNRQYNTRVFNQLKLNNDTKPAEALRDIALLFKEVGDMNTAYKLMSKALELRPKGPFIKQKVQEWEVEKL